MVTGMFWVSGDVQASGGNGQSDGASSAGPGLLLCVTVIAHSLANNLRPKLRADS